MMKTISIGLGIFGLLVIFYNGYWFWNGVTIQDTHITEAKSSHNQTNLDKSIKLVTGEKFGTLSIPDLELNLPILHGTTQNELKKGVGHYEKSAVPGENRHIVLAGHRDTVFQKLKHVEVGDEIWIKTANGTFLYNVNKTRIVNKRDRTVLVEKPVETLTLVTCYPFQYIGKAPERFIVTAKLVK